MRALHMTVIYLGHTLRNASNDLPEGDARAMQPSYLVFLRVGFTLPGMSPPPR